MEAICCSIPVMVTSFGGNKEIAMRSSGFLLSENPTIEEISSRLCEITDLDDLYSYRVNARNAWMKYYNSESNYLKFSEDIEGIFS